MSEVGNCRRENCFAPDLLCIDGVVGDHANCKFFQGDEAAPGTDEPGPAVTRLPWSGLALGTSDLTAVTALGEARVVALIGPADAGKTTTLAAAQLARRRGEGGCGTFAGSYTLLGWNSITRHMEWAPWGGGSFPPHTVLGDSRTPALLHMALRQGSGTIRHVLYSDVPGEWYERWAYDAIAVPGANWLVDNADAFMLFADSEALAGPQRGEARVRYRLLAERLHSVVRDRPVVAVRSKADVEITDQMRQTIERLNTDLFGVETLLISAHQEQGQSLAKAVDQATRAALSFQVLGALPTPREGGDSLFAFRDPSFVT